MKGLRKIITVSFVAAATIFGINSLNAQCGNWTELPPAEMEEAENAHVVYRGFVKNEQFTEAFEMWNKAYTAAPAADGQRPFHYTDGRDIYMSMYNAETDAAKKKEYVDIILRLYDEEIACYGAKGNDAFLTGRKAFDMFYYLAVPYAKVLTTLEKSVEMAGDKTEYVVLDPYARVAVYQFDKEKMTKDEARAVHTRLNEIADYNIANHETQKEQYQQAKDAMNGVFAQIENSIFDCDYFYTKLVPEYQANPNDRDTYLRVYKKLLQRGCDENDPVIQEIKEKDRVYVMTELRTNNPGYAANELYKAGDFAGALVKYDEAIAKETDPTSQAKLYFSKASIEFRKQNKYAAARTSALKAASLDSSYGKPYELIGDMYAKGARNCGNDAWGNSLAVLAAISKYQKAKSIDPSLASSCNKKINTYSGSKPNKETGFMQGVKEGSTAKVPCWIGETVTVRY